MKAFPLNLGTHSENITGKMEVSTANSCHVMSCHVTSCHSKQCMWHHIMLHHVMLYHVMSCHAISCHITLCHATPHHDMMSCDVTWPGMTCCDMMRCDMLWCGLTWHDIEWCKMMLCDMTWHGMPHTLQPHCLSVAIPVIFTVRWQSLRNCGHISIMCLSCYFDTYESRPWCMYKPQHQT